MEEPQNIYRINDDGREFILSGTAHISRESAELVERVIIDEKPDTVCIDLCASRYQSITQKSQWQRNKNISQTFHNRRSHSSMSDQKHEP